MLPGSAIVMECLPAHLAAEELPQSVFSDILTTILHTEASTGCNAIFFWQRQEYMLENVLQMCHLFTGVGRDGNVTALENVYV